jgi:hypothetical protein
MEEDGWLLQSIVLSRIFRRRGRYFVVIVFVDYQDPLHLRQRPIDDYPTEKKARTYAGMYQRQMNRGSRAPLQLPQDAFNLCLN